MEVEIKLAVPDADGMARRLEAGGAVLRSPRALEDNRLFDLPDRPLTRSGRVLRVREKAGRVTMTAKALPGDRADPRYKVRHEAETTLPDAAGMVALLRVAGFEVLWRYQKYRRVYDWEGAELALDETPVGSFLEVEAEPAAIERIVARLGDAVGARITATYREVWEEACARRGEEPGDMVFAGVPEEAE